MNFLQVTFDNLTSANSVQFYSPQKFPLKEVLHSKI